MVFNKNTFLAIFTALGIQVVFGINLANAVCDNEIEKFCKAADKQNQSGSRDYSQYSSVSECIKVWKNDEYNIKLSKQSDQELRDVIEYELEAINSNLNDKSAFFLKKEAHVCQANAVINIRKSGNKSNSSSNQPSNSGASSSQTNSPQPTAQSSNTQTNTSQQTTTSKKGKKNPNDVPAKCVKFNHDKTKIVNMCNFPINFSFCMLHQDDQTIQVANSCNNGFVNETVYPGRAISDESLDTRFFGISCKFPSKPINVRFISYSEPLEGNCPR